ncbi:hypothetical protein BU15DRAFT_48718 [Melanogaster broomeanus]|nr:hypothetical protein BU15DRAFT_48718 [Melanogaster broomeanus]
MAVAARRLAINPYGDQYPDDNSTKEVVLQADGLVPNPVDRHVLLCWMNGMNADGCHYAQIIHLSGGPGNYNFYTPQVKLHPKESQTLNTCFVLGQYTRAQRDQIIALAKAIQFDKKSRINSCRTWTRDLLEAMVNAGLFSKAKFDEIDASVPLKKRVPELPEDTA